MVLPLHDDNPTRTRPLVTIALIAICIAVFALQLLSGPEGNQRIVYALGVIPAVLLGDTVLPAELAWVPRGASGAISGVLGAYLLLYPRAKVLLGLPLGFLIVRIGYFPAFWVLGSWFGLKLLLGYLAGPDTQGGVAFGAHIGGFIAGLLLVALFKQRDVRLWRGY